jgi:sugar lactone lactonase YvrE
MRLLFPLTALAGSLYAAGTAYWEMDSYAEFLKGRFEGISLTREGSLRLAPRTETVFGTDQPVVWSLARDGADRIYIATGHRGQVHRWSSGKSELYWTAPEPEVFALAVDSKGVLFAGTSPDGKIYRIENGKGEEYFNPKSKYIWSLAFDPAGALYAGTGDEGKVFRISVPGQGEAYYESGQTHITALAFDTQGRLLAGSEPNGILYRITAKDRAFVLYDASLPEIRAIVPAADGRVYVAALGGAFGRKQAGAAGAVTAVTAPITVTATSTSITVEGAQGGVEIKPKPEAKPPPAAPAAAPAAVPLLDVSGVEKSALYLIHPDNLVETLWSSKEENIYGLAQSGAAVLFSTDTQGRIYRLDADRKAALLLETREGETTRLVASPGGILAATSHGGKLLRLSEQPGESGTYVAPVHDAGNAARWGRISWRWEAAPSTKLAFRTRSGNSARPDKTWSEWSPPVSSPGSLVASPNARYIQWKVEFSGSAGNTPSLQSVTIAYLPQNTPPVVKSVTVSAQASATPAKPAAASAASAAYSITVTDTTEQTASSAGNPTQTVARASSSQLVISWQAEDSDGDKLSYSIYFRGEEERGWKLLKNNWTELALTLDGESLADGKYYFRVTATDAPSNPQPWARETDLVSAPFLIDNTPPAVKTSVPRRSGTSVEVDVDAEDAVSPVRRAECSLNAGPWIPLEVEDGVADSLKERFLLRLGNVASGENLLVIRAVDSAGNAALAKVVLR